MKIRNQVVLISFFSCIFPLMVVSVMAYLSLEKEIKLLERKKVDVVFFSAENYLDNINENLRIHIDILDEIYRESGTNKMVKSMTSFSNKDRETVYFIFGDERGGFYQEEWVNETLPSDYDPRKRPWYKGAREKPGGYYISEIFTHAATGEPALTISKAVEGSGRVDGVIGVLLNLNELKNILGNYTIGETGHFFLLDKHGDLVLDTGDNKKYLTKEIIRKFLENLNGEVEIDTGKDERHYFVYQVDNTDMILVGGTSHGELMYPITRLKRTVALTVFFTFFLTSLFIIILTNKFSQSLKRLSYIIDNIARGNYTKNIKRLTHIIDDKNELYLVKEGIIRMQDEIKKREKQLKLVSETDSLTGVYNRGAILNILAMEIDRSVKFKTEFCVLMYDLDKFKSINDRHGHQFGDEVLKRVSATVQNTLKIKDSLGRYGGEEFFIVLPDTPGAGGVAAAHRIMEKIRNLTWKDGVDVRISMGVECWREGHDEKSIISVVDGLLYRAKKNGRDRIESNIK